MRKILHANFDLLGPIPKEVPPKLAHKLGQLAELDPQIADLILPKVAPSAKRVVEKVELEQVERKTQVPLSTDEPRLA